MPKIALVAGGTGLVGGHLIDLLIQSNAYDEIKVLVRKGSSFERKDISMVEIDFDHLMEFGDILKADVVFCCLGTTIKKAGSKEKFRMVDFHYPLDLAKATLKLGAQQFNIVTANGANSKSLFFYSRVKGDIEKALMDLKFESLNIFRPSLLLGNRNEKRVGEDIGAAVAKIINPTLLGKMRKYRAVQAETVARSMLKSSMQIIKGVRIIESDEIQNLGKEL